MGKTAMGGPSYTISIFQSAFKLCASSIRRTGMSQQIKGWSTRDRPARRFTGRLPASKICAAPGKPRSILVSPVTTRIKIVHKGLADMQNRRGLSEL